MSLSSREHPITCKIIQHQDPSLPSPTRGRLIHRTPLSLVYSTVFKSPLLQGSDRFARGSEDSVLEGRSFHTTWRQGCSRHLSCQCFCSPASLLGRKWPLYIHRDTTPGKLLAEPDGLTSFCRVENASDGLLESWFFSSGCPRVAWNQ